MIIRRFCAGRRRALVTGVAAGCAALLAFGCSATGWRLDLEPGATQTLEGVGAGQGAAVIRGELVLYGDADTGVAMVGRAQGDPPTRFEVARVLELTENGVDLAPHPTGLTHHPEHGTFLGNTVAGVGTIFHVDWERLRSGGTLDGAVLNTTIDDIAVNGCRPEFVRYRGRWLVATSDYGDVDNAVRLYDPALLARAARTSEPGVLVASFPCGPFVQTMHWLDEPGVLLLVQNQVAGLRYRFTAIDLESGDDFRDAPYADLPEPWDELEGFAMLAGGFPGVGERWPAVTLSAMRDENVRYWSAVLRRR